MAHIGMILIGDIRYDGRVRKEIATLVQAGHQVELVVSDFNKTASDGQELGIKIHYIPMTLWKIPIINFYEQLAFNRKAVSVVKEIDPTYVHCHDLNTLLAGVRIKKETKAKLVYDAHELFPELWEGIRERVWNRIENRLVDKCDYIIMPEANRISYFKKKYPNSAEPLLLENFPYKKSIPSDMKDIFREKFPIGSDQKIILYTGIIDRKRHVEELIKSMTICGDQYGLIILGKYIKNSDKLLNSIINDLDLNHKVFLHGPVPNADILSYMSSCDIGTAFYSNTNINNYYCAPNKVYEYIALEKVVLTNNYPGLREIVADSRQGICLEEITPESLAQAYELADDSSFIHPGAKKYFWEDTQDVLIELYKS